MRKLGLLALLSILILSFSCDRNNNDQFSGFANAFVNSIDFQSNNPEFSISNFTDPSTKDVLERTRINLPGNKANYLILNFEGKKTGNFNLTIDGINTATYIDEFGNEYISSNGVLIITTYETKDGVTTIDGNFEFSAQSFINQGIANVTVGNFSITKN